MKTLIQRKGQPIEANREQHYIQATNSPMAKSLKGDFSSPVVFRSTRIPDIKTQDNFHI